MKNMIIIIMIMLTTSACSMANRDSSVSLNEPPVPIINEGEKRVPVLYTAYCWKIDTEGKCADFPQPDFAFKDQAPIVVSPGCHAGNRLQNTSATNSCNSGNIVAR
jgi:hypothetical protein